MRLPGCVAASAIRSPSSPRARPSANVPSSAWHAASQRREVTAGRSADRSARGAAPRRGTPRSARGTRSPDDSRPGPSRRCRGNGSPAPASTTSPPAVASARARWPAAMAWSCAPTPENGGQHRRDPCPADADRRGPRRGPRPRAGAPGYAHSSPSGRSAVRRASRRSMACSRVSRVSGRCARALSACSKYPTASRWADRAMAFSPACRQ